MKKIVGTILALFLMVGVAFAQPAEWRVPSQDTITWSAVTTLENGDPLPAGATVDYIIYLSPYPVVGDPQDYTNQPSVGVTVETNYVLTFTAEGVWVAGVQPVRKDAQGNEISRAAISWTDDPEGTLNGQTFGWSFWYKPAKITDLQ